VGEVDLVDVACGDVLECFLDHVDVFGFFDEVEFFGVD